MSIYKRAALHFEANCDDDFNVPNLPDIIEQLREEFPNRIVHPQYVKEVYYRWRPSKPVTH